MIGQIGRLARVAQLGWRSGRALSNAESLRAGASNIGANAPHAMKAMQQGMVGQSKVYDAAAGRAMESANRYGAWTGLDPTSTKSVAGVAQDYGRWLNPIVTPVEGVTKGASRLAMGAMNNPIGQTALFMGLPMMMMSGGGQPAYTESPPMVEGYMPPSSPPMPQEMMMQPSSPLDEEQIRRARKRAEEQAALNSFYAQALQQYGG